VIALQLKQEELLTLTLVFEAVVAAQKLLLAAE
jgi:hypothetical protein